MSSEKSEQPPSSDQPSAAAQPPPYVPAGQPVVYGQPAGQGLPAAYITSPGHPVVYGQPGPNRQIAGYGPLVGYPPNTVVVQHPGPYGVVRPGVRPPDYLVLSIISIFFCWPMAICAVMYSCNSKTSADTGDIVRAESEGRTARNVGIAAIVIGILIIVVCVAVPLGIISSYSHSYTYSCSNGYCSSY